MGKDAKKKQPPPTPVKVILEAGPYRGERSMFLRDLSLLVRYVDSGGRETPVTDLPVTDLFRVINGGLAVFMMLLDRVKVPVVHRRFFDSARDEIEKSVNAVGRMIEGKERDPLVTVEIRGGLARSVARAKDLDGEDGDGEESGHKNRKPGVKRQWDDDQRAAAHARMLEAREAGTAAAAAAGRAAGGVHA